MKTVHDMNIQRDGEDREKRDGEEREKRDGEEREKRDREEREKRDGRDRERDRETRLTKHKSTATQQ